MADSLNNLAKSKAHTDSLRGAKMYRSLALALIESGRDIAGVDVDDTPVRGHHE